MNAKTCECTEAISVKLNDKLLSSVQLEAAMCKYIVLIHIYMCIVHNIIIIWCYVCVTVCLSLLTVILYQW